MNLRGHLLALLGGALMASSAVAAPGVEVNWTNLVHKDAAGKDQTRTVNRDDPDVGYDGGLGLPAMAVKNNVVLKGEYGPAGGKAKITVTIRDKDTSASRAYNGTFDKGKWEITIPKGSLRVATVYDIIVEVTTDDGAKFAKYCMNIANN